MNGFRAPHCRSRPPHLHRRVCTSAASLPRGPTCGRTPLVPRPSCPLIPGAGPWCVSLSRPALHPLHCPLPSSVRRRCCVLDQEERLCPLRCACPSVRGSRAGYHAYTATPREVKVRVPRPSPMCPAGVLSPTSSPPAPRGQSPQQNFGAARHIPPGWSVGDPLASPWEETVGRPGVIALRLPHLVEFRCHCPSPHAQHARRPVLTWDSQVAQ